MSWRYIFISSKVSKNPYLSCILVIVSDNVKLSLKSTRLWCGRLRVQAPDWTNTQGLRTNEECAVFKPLSVSSVLVSRGH